MSLSCSSIHHWQKNFTSQLFGFDLEQVHPSHPGHERRRFFAFFRFLDLELVQGFLLGKGARTGRQWLIELSAGEDERSSGDQLRAVQQAER